MVYEMDDDEELQSCDYYYDTYAHFSNHEAILNDHVRTIAYKNAISANPELFRGKTILDVGSGTGILSLFSAQAGARKVYGVDKSTIAGWSRKIVRANDYSSQIEIIESCMEDITLPEQVDVIISDWMGHCLIQGSILGSVVSARDRFLKADGSMFPSKVRLFIAGIEDSAFQAEYVDFWDDVFGFSFSPIKNWVVLESVHGTCSPDKILTQVCVLADINLNTCPGDVLSLEAPFRLIPVKTDTLHAFIVWFDAIFEGGESRIELSTSPFRESTHWRQTLFYLANPFVAVRSQPITGRFRMGRSATNSNESEVTIHWITDRIEHEQYFKITSRIGQ
jgi:protein arginine N-methyltransferase 1